MRVELERQQQWKDARFAPHTENEPGETLPTSEHRFDFPLSQTEQAIQRVQRYLDDLEVLMLEDLQDLAEPLQQAFDLTDDSVKRNEIVAVCCLSMGLRTQVQAHCAAMRMCFGEQEALDVTTDVNPLP